MLTTLRLTALLLLSATFLPAQTAVQTQVPQSPADVQGPREPGSEQEPFNAYRLLQAPAPDGLLLQKGDRLAIIGDSITEQKMYSRIIETYLTVCVPDLEITARQFGWSGETAEGFLRRMESDCLRFKPTIATLCYGMNDHRYRTYDPQNGQWYKDNYTAVVQGLQKTGARVVVGSPGCVGKVPHWTKSEAFTLEQLNLNLATLRNIDIAIAAENKARFADVFWPMLKADHEARERHGADYAVPGKDGVHPGWSGQLIMAWAFLQALGLDGDLGTISVDLAAATATGSSGHEVTGFADGVLTIHSTRYPFCTEGDPANDNSIRSGTTLVPFHQTLNRLTLQVTGGSAANYEVSWGPTKKTYPAADLAEGINLAADFSVNPFSPAFKKVDEAVAAKQGYETEQIKKVFHSAEFKSDPEATVAATEKIRQPLAEAIAAALVPVDHELRITPVQ